MTLVTLTHLNFSYLWKKVLSPIACYKNNLICPPKINRATFTMVFTPGDELKTFKQIHLTQFCLPTIKKPLSFCKHAKLTAKE